MVAHKTHKIASPESRHPARGTPDQTRRRVVRIAPSGTYEGDESVPAHGDEADFETKFTNEPPHDVKPETPPYEGRQTEAKPGSGKEAGARTGGATAPTTDSEYKSQAPGSTPGGATASPGRRAARFSGVGIRHRR